MEISKEFRFESAHRLPHTPADHKCQRLHGHSFRVEVVVSGELVEPQGWVCDFADLTAAWQPIHELIDHRYLNEVDGLSNPTSENIAIWLWPRLLAKLPGLCRITVHETCTSRAIYTGPQSQASSRSR